LSEVAVTTGADRVRFAVRVQPRASRNEIAGVHGVALKVRLHAPPVDGAANEALIEFLSERLGVSRRSVAIIAGHSSRSKMVEVEGISAASVQSLAKGAGSA
jgi:uncharacterized protein (TIGR00251 family)